MLTTALLLNVGFADVHRGNGYRMRVVVIDPGHGGHDAGCLGSSGKEKNVALSIALKMGKMIEDKYPDIKVIYTRKTDVFIPLFERAEIANRNKADLFICIHCNSDGKKKAAYGVETYVMGLHKSEDNLNVAKRENASILLEENYKKQYDGFDPNSPEANIIFSLYQNQFMNQSLSFASRVQNQVDEYAGRYNRGVKQAGFLVLYKTAMPSVLIETGFLTQNDEEKFLLNEKGQNTIATCIFRAFKEYKLDIEDSGSDEPVIAKLQDEKPVDETPKHDSTPVKETKTLADTSKTNEKKVIAPADSAPAIKAKPAAVVGQDAKIKSTKNDSAKTKNSFDRPSLLDPLKENKAAAKKSTKDNLKSATQSKIYLTVQIAASTNAAKDLPKYMHIEDVHSVKGDDGFVRFVVGTFTSMNDARKRLAKLKTDGFKDAFVTAYNGDKRITVNEAVELLK